MSGQPKQGIDYAGWSVDIFDGDEKIDKLMDAQGCTGFVIYFYLCQMAYKHDGYFYRWSYDNAATTARRVGGGVGSETVKNTVGLCLQIGLFNKPLFDRDGILTSKGIQRRYCAAVQKRRSKSVIKKYWLLNDEESKGLDKCADNDDLQQENIHLQTANGHSQTANDYKSKVKESKVNKTPYIPPQGETGFGDELQSAFESWIRYKIEKRQPYKQTGLKSLITEIRNNANRYGEKEVADLITQCMASNWQGIIFDRLKPAKAQQRGQAKRDPLERQSATMEDFERMKRYLDGGST